MEMAARLSQSLSAKLLNSTFRQQLLDKEAPPVFAGWLQSGDWRTARALSAHHSLVVIDAEHGGISLDQIACCIEVMGGNDCLSFVRVPFDSDDRKSFARRCLDAGAVGILFPNVQSLAEAKTAVMNCYYPSDEYPEGGRGFGYGGCNIDGLGFGEYAKTANDIVCIGVQLENRHAFNPRSNCSEIMTCPGLVFTQDGPYDHSGSYLCSGNTCDPRVVSDLEEYRRIAADHGVASGKHVVVVTDKAIQENVANGYKFIALGTDMMHVMSGAERVLKIARGEESTAINE